MTTGDTVLRGLTIAQAKVEQLMFDAVVIRRNAGGDADDVLDTASGRLYRPSLDTTVIYDGDSVGTGSRPLGHESGLGGIAKLSAPPGSTNAGTDVTDPDESVNRMRVSIPIDAPEVLRYDWITVTYAERDPQLLGAVFIVDDVIVGTMKVARALIATRYVQAVRS